MVAPNMHLWYQVSTNLIEFRLKFSCILDPGGGGGGGGGGALGYLGGAHTFVIKIKKYP